MPRPQSPFALIEFPDEVATFQQLYGTPHWWNDIGVARLFLVSGYAYVCANTGIIGTGQLARFKNACDAARSWKQALPFEEQWNIGGPQLKRAMREEPMCLVKILGAIAALEQAVDTQSANNGAPRINVYDTVRIQLATFGLEEFNARIYNDFKANHPDCIDNFKADLQGVLSPESDFDRLITDMAAGLHVTKPIAESAATHFGGSGREFRVTLARRNTAGAVKPASKHLKFLPRPIIEV